MGVDVPKPNTLAISWFFGEFEKKTLILDPKYQRNPIWSLGQKCFLIDSIIMGCPIPQVYINIKTETKEKERKTFYEVVDGQQRLRSILEFLNDEWELIKIAPRAYPVSDEYKKFIGKKYSELPSDIQDLIWNCSIAVQELRSWDPKQVNVLFRRLNYVVERLNRQEMRHSQYFGLFSETTEKFTKYPFWDEINIFTRKDDQRMKDVEFIAGLFIIIIDGVQEQQSSIDKFYADYDVVFPQQKKVIQKFDLIIDSLIKIKETIKDTRFKNKADFYGLFAAVSNLVQDKSINLDKAKNALKNLSRDLENGDLRNDMQKEYQSTLIEGLNKLSNRKKRSEILEGIIRKALNE